ncbi:uncharacterized protein LOC111129451 [Crassostrea virginica]|uniref:Uncharacterized protein LOC111129451 n=1 Tax=Crassostrea virginica TaxID=6565 RepID=A0A8B8DUI3_CRAVI|nr:uncharacterized protein LOC111129451 [Crassostrea virginica]XP_022332637.1 uncharacterized protein LOC111130172 [Crassostrea virginica]
MKGLQALRRGFSTSTIRQGRLQDPKNPGFLIPVSKPGQVYSYENFVQKKMRTYLEPSKDFTHNRWRHGKIYVGAVSALAVISVFIHGYYNLPRLVFGKKA